MFKEFHVRDVVFLAVLSAVLLLSSGLIMPLVMFTHLYALRQMFAAPFFSFFAAVALMKVPKLGALTLVGVFTGMVLLIMSPIMLVNQLLGAFIAELVAWLLFRGYHRPQAQLTAASLFVPLTLPITLGANYLMNDQALTAQIGSIPIAVLIILGTIALSVLFAMLGLKLGRELRKAGKL